MSIQTATTGQLENAQRIIIANTLYTEEHNRPTTNLLQQFSLGQGEKTLTVPKVAQMTAARLVDGVDLVNSEDIGMTTTDISPVEAGLKVIISDKLARQENESVFTMVGNQMGQAMGRLMERDAIALFTALNGGTALGSTTVVMTLDNLSACIAYARAHKFGAKLVIVHHPNAVFEIARANVVQVSPRWTSAMGPLPEALLQDFYTFSISGVPVFETAEIDAVTTNSGTGAIFDPTAALGMLTSKGLSSATERDESLRATEVIAVADYQAFELDDARGAPMTYQVDDLTTATS